MRISVSILSFICISTSLGLALSEIFGSLSKAIVIFSFVAAFGVATFLHRRLKNSNLVVPKAKLFDWAMIFIFGIFCYRFFGWLMFAKAGGVATLDVNNFGDLPGHIGYVNNLVNEKHFWPESPIIVGERFNYPFGMDLFSAMFSKLRVPLEVSMPITGFVCGLILAFALFLWGGSFTIASFLFSGGAAGYVFFATRILKDYQAELAWKSIVLALFLPQRGFLYAFPVGLLLLWSWRQRIVKKAGVTPLPNAVEGLAWGLMPLFHIHTFLFLSLVFAAWVVAQRKIKEGLRIFAWAVVPACYEMYQLTNHFGRSSVLWLKPGWMIENQNVFIFFWNNYGLYVPLVFISCVLIWREKRRDLALLMIPAAAVYILCLFVMFAPWDWDNTKLMVWSYLLCLPVISDLVIERLNWFLRAPLFVLLFVSGFVGVYAAYDSSNTGYVMYNRDEVEGACLALASINHDNRFATAQIHNHPVSLCGYRLVAGYAGTLWSQGQVSKDIPEKLHRLMMGDSGWQSLAKDIKARYLFWGPAEEREFKDSVRPWENTKAKIAKGSWGTIYDLGE